jgi:DNA-binding transcriptional regulator GbsR (MarR family)
METESLLLKTLGKSPQMRIMDFFIDNRLFDFSKKEIIEELGMSKTTFYKVWRELESLNIAKVNRKFGKTKLYILNAENEIVKNLLQIEKQLIMGPADNKPETQTAVEAKSIINESPSPTQ